MKLPTILKTVERLVINNSPTLLTAFGVTGTLTTAYLTGKATFKAAEIIAEERAKRAAEVVEFTAADEPTVKEKASLVWLCYIPPVISVVTTIGCIVGANTINTSRMTALAAAYAVTNKDLSEYKSKVSELFGEKKEENVRASIAQDYVDKTPPVNVLRGQGGDVLVLDKWTGRYFTSDMETIRATENDFVKGMLHGNDVGTLGDFYASLGLPVPKCSDSVGWNNDSPLDITFSSVLWEGRPVLVMDFANDPFPIHGYFGHP